MASIISSALLNIEALSIEIFRPIDQLGWARAISAVTSAISSRVHVRNGPAGCRQDDALDARGAGRLPATWKMALCSLSTGQQPAAAVGHGLDEEVAGGNQALLVGERDVGAAPGRGERRCQPGRADDGRHHPVRLAGASLDQRLAPARRLRSRFRRARPSTRND